MSGLDPTCHLMLLPTLACPAACSYCFGPHEGGVTMSRETAEAIVRWEQQTGNGRPLEVAFHGGEPLVPGVEFYRMVLPLLRDGLAPRPVRFTMQSNLWLLTDGLCELFEEYEVSLGTSLDGPETINDAQRGAGHFRRTMAGIERAREHGLAVGCICTFTDRSATQAGSVVGFFLQEGLGFSVHAALRPLGESRSDGALSPEAHGRLLVELLERYLDNAARIRIRTLDAMCRSVSAGKGGVCTFTDCLGHYLAVDPDGWIYPCQRMAGMAPFRLGNVGDCPTTDDLARAPLWRALSEREERIAEACDGCPHLGYCRGGCPYNVLAGHGGDLTGFSDLAGPDLRDPHSPAYRQAFDAITERALAEVLSEQNLAAVVADGSGKHGLLRKGTLLQIMRGGPHPHEVARQAREAVAAVALAACQTPEAALRRLEQAGVITHPAAALASLRALRDHLDTQSRQRLVNAYVHVTDACNLACRHCYARPQTPADASAMAVEDVAGLVRQAARAGFAKAVVTGGEPLMHSQRGALLDALAGLRRAVKPMQIALRTNLACTLTPRLTGLLLSAADEVVISVDGDRASHDAQRGTGSYDCTVRNLRVLRDRWALCDEPRPRLILAATLTAAQMEGPAGEAVRALGEELELAVRCKPVLPLGRGTGLGWRPAFFSSLDEDGELPASRARPVATCGLGMNLYVGSDGTCYPCYALMASRHYLGNAVRDGLVRVLAANDAYRQVTVDSNRGCRACTLRYLCGGHCRAWGDGDDPDAPPHDCAALYARAERHLRSAMVVLDVGMDRWQAAGLP